MGTYVYYPIGTEKQKLSEPIVIEDAIPPIIDKQTFIEVQKIMESRAHTGRLKAVEPYLLSGILFCGICGSAMNGHRRNRNGNPEYSYECGSNARKKTCSMRNFSRDKLESIVCAYVRRLFSDNALAEIQIYLKENTDRINRDNIKAQHTLEREISSLDTKIENVINLLIDTPSSKLKEKLMSLEARQKELSVELEQLQCATLSNDKIDQYILRLNHFDDMNREEKQFYIKKAI